MVMLIIVEIETDKHIHEYPVAYPNLTHISRLYRKADKNS